jgi:beta-phosphoglucomutase-like phosphatase (HAD superfamily)
VTDIGFQAAIFDMDGVITRTADLHAAAWKELLDGLLGRLARDGEPYRPFDERVEYRAYVDGKPRREGLRSFLRARRIRNGGEERILQGARTRCSSSACAAGIETFPRRSA